MALPERIPVFFLSGFLGSGKSTLLNEVLADPGFRDTTVIINEFGNVAIDHLLVRQGETAISQVSTGCLCCSGTTDIRATLFDLHCAATDGLAPVFSRVIVELSGLGDPAPLVNALIANRHSTQTLRDRTLDSIFYLAGIVTLYDIILGELSIERHFEAMKQIAFADRIVLTKTDLAKDPATLADIAALPQELAMLNAAAEIVDRRKADLASLFSPRPYSVVERGEDVSGWLALEAALAAEMRHAPAPTGHGRRSRHAAGIRSFSIVHDAPVPEKRFFQFLSVLQQSAGQQLLRVKGIVGLAEDPECPRIIHAVQHSMSDPVRLKAWPDGDRRTRLVFITSDIDPEPVRKLFSAVIGGKPSRFDRLLGRISDTAMVPLSRFSSYLTTLSRRSS
ncbi:CobW family GTP-binding protein [Hoeflea sp.]|uniref:CobW family GTP-binding protein n=1 Tax=Hoeflea sp. TaxID=1940281 RepID=UPI003748CCC4